MRLSHFVNGICTMAALVGVVPAFAAGAAGDLYVTSGQTNSARAYGGATGDDFGVHFSSAGPSGMTRIHFGATNGRVLVGHVSGAVQEFDVVTGTLVRSYNPSGVGQVMGVYAPDGHVYVGGFTSNEIRKYDSTTGALIGVMRSFPGPMGMEYGPNGNLFVCSFTTGAVHELHPNTLATVSSWAVDPSFPPEFVNPIDVAFHPDGRIFVVEFGTGQCFAYGAARTRIGTVSNPNLYRAISVTVSPHTGRVLVADAATTTPYEPWKPQVWEHDPVTLQVVGDAFLDPDPITSVYDLAFRPGVPPTPTAPTSWGRIKDRYR